MSELAAIPEGAAKSAGIAAGAAAAAAMLAARAGDGRYGSFTFSVGTGLGEWTPTSGVNDPSAWVARVRPFVLESQSQFRTDGPLPLAGAAYAEEYDEVKRLGRLDSPDRTERQTAIARLHSANPIELWNRTLRDITAGDGTVEQARLFAMATMAGADSLITTWDDKEFWSFWRPVTAIRRGDGGRQRRDRGRPGLDAADHHAALSRSPVGLHRGDRRDAARRRRGARDAGTWSFTAQRPGSATTLRVPAGWTRPSATWSTPGSGWASTSAPPTSSRWSSAARSRTGSASTISGRRRTTLARAGPRARPRLRRRMSGLDERTRWEPADAERAIFERWLESGLFAPEPAGTAEENYSIAIPPPNVTGALHMGHALNGSVQDCLIRYNRMLGRRVRWILGTDHAGIATQTQVEKLLKREGTTRQAIGREAFVERVWQWREEYGGIIFKQFQRLGASCDYEHERFTLDPQYVRAVMKVFVDLHAKGLIYRDNRIVNWDPGSRSAISDLEVEEREVSDTLYHVDYPLASGGGSITVATVRPETMLADTAIAVHPDDERYTRLVGETAILPIVGRRLRIIADPYVKPEFGTGALKITPGHDPNDFEIGRAHGLEEITVIGEDGRMNEEAGEAFAGMTPLDAREAVVEALREQGVLARTEPYTHAVPVLPPQRGADRAADLPAVVHEDGGARRARDRGGARRHAAHPSREPAPALPRVAGEHPAVVHLPPALVGPPDPRLVPRGGRPTSAWSRRRGTAGSATRTCSTPGSPPACGRSPRSAGPTTRRSCAPSTRPTCSPRAATSSSSGSRAW